MSDFQETALLHVVNLLEQRYKGLVSSYEQIRDGDKLKATLRTWKNDQHELQVQIVFHEGESTMYYREVAREGIRS